MEINKLVFGGLIAGCLAAAGGGAYLATRHNAQETQGAVQASPAPAAAAEVPPAGQPVTASEGVLTPEPTRSAPAPAPAVVPVTRPGASGRDPAPLRRRPRHAASLPPRRQAAARPAPPIQPAPAPAPSSSGSMWEARPAVQADAPERQAPEPEPVAPPEPVLVELVVPADAVMGLQLETTVSSERAKVEDAVDARVTRDVRVGGRVAIPAGSVVHGTVTEVARGGKVREKARLSIRFHTVVARQRRSAGAAHRRHHPRRHVAGTRERREDRRRGGRRGDSRGDPRRRQGRGDRRRRRCRRWHRGGDGRRTQLGHHSRRLHRERADTAAGVGHRRKGIGREGIAQS